MSNILNRPWLIVGASVLVVGGVVLAQNMKPGPAVFGGNVVQLKPAGLSTGVNISSLKQLDDTFSALSEAASQAAVYITTDTKDKSANDPMAMLQGGKSGSGFIYRSDGWIVTNDHVVAGSDKVKVVLADGRELIGKVTQANDQQLDLAVIKVDEKDLPTLAFADSSKIRVGQIAMAIGAPFGLEDTVTIGHISAMGRPGLIPDPSTGKVRAYSGLIQTDASINPGNSGGPLIDINGDVLGINSAINSSSGASAGIAFAIPSNVVKVVADELIATGKFDRGMMGVDPRDLKPFEKKKLNLNGGAYAKGIQEGTPASKSGIKQGDIITAIDNMPIAGEIDLRIAMYKHAPKQTVSVTYLHDGQTKTTNVTLEAPAVQPVQKMPQQQQNPFGNGEGDQLFGQPDQNGGQGDGAPEAQSGKPRLGVTVQQIDGTARQQYSLPNDQNGVVVSSVADGSFASKVNLQSGDVILSINGKSVSTVTDLTDSMASVKWGDQVTLKFTRFANGKPTQFTVTVPFK